MFFGTIVGVILAFGLSFIIGPIGGVVFLGILFGLVFSTYQRNKMIYEDLQLIKEKLGIDEKSIEYENERFEIIDSVEETEELRELNKEIEKELEEYYKRNKNEKE